jgi:hypothetical protein
MLLKFKLKNYKSYLNEQIFSMEKSSDTLLTEHILNADNSDALKFSAIYGANASGKSNLLEAIKYFQFIVRTSKMLELNDNLPYNPHKLNANEGTTLGLLFVKNNIKYYYEIKLDNISILEEKLYYYKNRQNVIFERTALDKFEINRDFQSEFNQMKDKTLKNKLFLSTIAAWSENEHIKNVIEFIKNDLVIITEVDNLNLIGYSSTLFTNGDKKFKKKFIKVFRDFGVSNLKNIDVSFDDKALFDEEDRDSIPDEIKTIISEIDRVIKDNTNNSAVRKRLEVKFNYKYKENEYNINLKNESRGVKKLFELLGIFFTIIKENKVLLIDEIECSIHPMVLNEILNLFTAESSKSQLIFTTHNEMFLDLSKLRRDEIWFVEKEDGTSSKIYSLWDIKGVRKNENIKTGYLNERYGAYPKIDLDSILISDKKGDYND